MHEPVDKDGNKVAPGMFVRMPAAPDELLSGLPASDQENILQAVGKRLRVQEFDQYGHVELTFKDLSGNIHFIWVRPSALEVVT